MVCRTEKRNGFDLTMTNWGFHFREILMSGSLNLKICIESNFDLIFFVTISFHFGCNPIFSQQIENSSNSITSSIFANSFCEFIANFRIDGSISEWQTTRKKNEYKNKTHCVNSFGYVNEITTDIFLGYTALHCVPLRR